MAMPAEQRARCPYCGEQVYASDDICVGCGRELLLRQPPPPAEPWMPPPPPPPPPTARPEAPFSRQMPFAPWPDPPPVSASRARAVSAWAIAGYICAGLGLLSLWPLCFVGGLCGLVALAGGDRRHGAVVMGINGGVLLLSLFLGMLIPST